ncbi:MAG: hypothetical protein IKT43_04900 [Clostridia bacterium]|nr:hypothetical protein [Clostridia bacterium]
MFSRLFAKFQHFMLGRRGIDTLGIALLIGSVVCSVLGSFFRYSLVARLVLGGLELVFTVVFLVRFFSRDILRRDAENRKFSRFWSQTKARWRDRKTHVFFTCPACKNTLRVPKGRGNVTVTCPVCKEQIKRRT